jgi:hypothetical protein
MVESNMMPMWKVTFRVLVRSKNLPRDVIEREERRRPVRPKHLTSKSPEIDSRSYTQVSAAVSYLEYINVVCLCYEK